MKSRILITTLMTVGLIALGACQKASEETAEKLIEASASAGGQKMDVEMSEGAKKLSMSAETDEGTVTMEAGEGAKMPDNFPSDVPVYQGFKPTFVQAVAEQEMFSVQGTVDAGLEGVASFYADQAISKGWTETMRQQQGNMQTLLYSKDDRMLTVMIISEGGQTNLTLTTAKQ